jgi:hypothetical protein
VTKKIVDHDRLQGLDGPKYKVGPHCCNPSCASWAADPHHMVSRKALGGPFNWVEIDGTIYQNLVGVCRSCHDDLTGRVGGHSAAIRLLDGVFWWCLLSSNAGLELRYHPTFPIEPQPSTPETLVERAPDNPLESETCPKCGQRRRRTPSNAGMRRGVRRRTWTVKVPDEEVERGADVLDALLEGIAPLVPNGDATTTGRYYVLAAALAYANQDLSRFAEAFSGVGG